jgi:hypothetical protein
VCERANRPTEAELFYRRAFAIASEVLEPDHPIAAISRQNLRDFCEARGLPFDVPSASAIVEPETTQASMDSVVESEPPPTAAEKSQPTPTVTDKSGATARVSAMFAPMAPATVESETPLPTTSSIFSFRAVAAFVVSAGLTVVVLIAARTWFGSHQQAEVSRQTAVQPAPTNQSTPAEPRAAAGVTPGAPILTSRATVSHDGVLMRSGKSRVSSVSAVSLPSSATALEARLCSDFSTRGSSDSPGEWRCSRASVPVEPGALVFYTRIRSDEDTTVQHRWYSGDELRRVVDLRIRGSRSFGFRTYSRTVVDNRHGGNWRVELRASDGTLIHEERFAVR